MSMGVRVKARGAERAKKRLKALGILNTEKKAKSDDEHVIFPVLAPVKDFEMVEADFEVQKRERYVDLLTEFLSQDEIGKVRFSFDIIGDIAIIEVPEELEERGARIGEALMKAHRHIKAVYRKSSEVRGEERIREFVHLAGETRTLTFHKEHGCTFKVDISKAYFSPRLSYERQRILKFTGDGEVVVDMFAGVGPFAVLLAKYRDVKVYAIDVNANAYELLIENIKLNKVRGKVVPLLGDSRALAPRGVASRVIMNLPMKASEYLRDAMDSVKSGVIHFYALSREDDLFDSWVKFIRKVGEEKGRNVEILGTRVVRPYAPRKHHVVVDIGVSP